MTLALRTERLRVRLLRAADAETLAAYRSDPQVARFQSWELPFTADAAVAMLAPQDAAADVAPGGWTQLAVEEAGRVVGDVGINLSADGVVAEIGFTLAPAAHGRGLAREAVAAVVRDLVERRGVGHVRAETDPANTASQRVLEAVGLVFEGALRRAFQVRGQWCDSAAYGASAAQLRGWWSRPAGPPGRVALVALTSANAAAYRRLSVHHSQDRFVAPMPVSLAEALYPPLEHGMPLVPRLHGVEADGEAAGFIMYAAVSETNPHPYLWRFLVDRRCQGRGIARRALTELCERLRDEGHRELLVSWVEGAGGPRPFYEAFGFVPTGDVDDGETIARLKL